MFPRLYIHIYAISKNKSKNTKNSGIIVRSLRTRMNISIRILLEIKRISANCDHYLGRSTK